MIRITSVGEGRDFLKSFSDKKFLMALFVIFLLAFAFWYFNPLVVTITGTSEVSAVPEKARISYLVTDVGATVGDAISKVGVKQNLLRSKILNSFNVSDSNITESQVSVIPPALSQNLNQYAASMAVDVKLNDYTQVSSFVSALYGEGASYVSQPVLLVENTKDLESQAYQLALKDADSKASAIGKKHLKFLKRRVAVSVAVSSPESVTTKREVMGTANEKQEAPIVSDSFKMTSVVTVTYKMW